MSRSRSSQWLGDAEHDKVTALARHRDLLEQARDQHATAPDDSSAGQHAAEQAQEVPQAAVVKVVPDEAEDLLSLGPVAYAKSLCDTMGVTREQRGPVALIARDMQTAYEAEQQRRDTLTEQQRQALENEIAGQKKGIAATRRAPRAHP